jgi:single-stranded DNA-binding protein
MSIEAAFFGALGRDAESKVSKTGKPYLRLNIRIGDGDAAQWVNVMTFDARAIEVAAQMLKGARVYVEGRLSLDEWTDQAGVKRHSLSVLSWHCRLAQIGRNKSKPEHDKSAASGRSDADQISTGRPRSDDAMSDEIPFVMEWRG